MYVCVLCQVRVRNSLRLGFSVANALTRSLEFRTTILSFAKFSLVIATLYIC